VDNYGANTVSLGAPDEALSTIGHAAWGVNAYNGQYVKGYETKRGSSMATPYVSGAALLILSACDVDAATLKRLIMDNVAPLPEFGRTVSNGQLNVYRAMTACFGKVVEAQVAEGQMTPYTFQSCEAFENYPGWAPVWNLGSVDCVAMDRLGAYRRMKVFLATNKTNPAKRWLTFIARRRGPGCRTGNGRADTRRLIGEASNTF
jgi:hypothetical protein